MTRKRSTVDAPFAGFDRPEANWFRMPNRWTDITAEITSIAELKVAEYILRHTWGYQEYGIKKHITIDEFVNGRRRQDGSRMDKGTGLSERAIYDGLRKAVQRGLVEEEVDASDRGRVKKSYCLKMRDGSTDSLGGVPLQDVQPGVQNLQGGVQNLQARGAKVIDRSEKDTQEIHLGSLSNIRMDTPIGNNASFSGPTGNQLPKLARQEDVEDLGSVQWQLAQPRQVVQQDEDYQTIQAYIVDFRRELNDQATLKQSTMRAYNLYRQSEIPVEEFLNQLYAARSIVKERTGAIHSQAGTDGYGVATKTKAAYFFAVLEDLLGLKDEQGPSRLDPRGTGGEG